MSNHDAVKIDMGLSPMFDFVLPDHDESGSLHGNEINGASEIPDPTVELFNKLAASRFEKSAGTFDATSGEPLTTPVAPSFSFIQNSDARLQKVCAALRKVFGDDHTEEFEEAVQIAERIRAEARAEGIDVAFSAVVPDKRRNIRPIERFGQGPVAKLDVEPQFAKIVALDEDDPNMQDLHF